MAKRKKQSSKVQKRKGARARPKAKKAAGKATKRVVAKAKPKRAPVKKVATVETVAVQVIEQPAPDVITVAEIEETEVRKAS